MNRREAMAPMTPPITMEVVDKSTTKRYTGGLAVAAILVAIAAVIATLLSYLCIRRIRRRKHKQQHSSSRIRTKSFELRRFRLDEVEKATDGLNRQCLVGSGAFGNVYKGVFEGEKALAVKMAHADSYISVEEFRNEVELLSRVKHRNLVGLVGYCDEAGQKILVYEYVPHGSLLEYIVGRRRNTLTWRQRVKIAIGAAKGIAHLHEGVQPSIIHRDIKPSNILVGEGLEAKVSDFGLVKTGPVGDASHVSSQIKGTPGYLDPAYCSSFHLTPFSDVYSFGVILLQLVAARPAVDTSRPQAQFHIIDWARPSLERGIVEEIIDANLLLEACNMEMMLKMGLLGLRCVVKSPKDRPTMRRVVRELEEALHSSVAFMNRGPSRLGDREESQVFSVDGVGLERFHVEIDGLSIETASMRCLDLNQVSMEVDKGDLVEIGEERDESYEAVLIH